MADECKPLSGESKIESLTDEQIARLAHVRDHWQGVRTAVGAADRDRAQAGVTEAYRATGLYEAPTRFVWLGSPHAGGIAAGLLRREAMRKLPGHSDRTKAAGGLATDVIATAVLEEAYERASTRVTNDVMISVLREVTRKVDAGNDLGIAMSGFGKWFNSGTGRWAEKYPTYPDWYDLDGITGSYVSRPWSDCADQVWGPVRGFASSMGRGALKGVGRAPSVISGQDGARGLSWFAGLALLGVPVIDLLGGLMQVSQSAGWWWPFENLVVMTERPVLRRQDSDGRLHCGDGPALVYPDGFSVWAWHGRRVPADLILGQWGVDRISVEPNAEIQRCAIERLDRETWPDRRG